MKQWMTGVLAAIVGGFIVFLLQGKYESLNKSRENEVVISEQNQPAMFEFKDVENISKSIDGDVLHRPVYIHIITIENSGTQDISGKSFSSPNAGAIAIGNISTPNDNERNVSISNDKGSVEVKYQLLPVGGKHSFWIASQDVIPGQVDFSAENPGVSLTKGSVDDQDSFWGLMGLIGGAIVLFIIGMFAGFSMLQSELKARGIDSDTALKLPKGKAAEKMQGEG